MIEKYRDSKNNGCIFQPVAMEIQAALGESSEVIITRLCSHGDKGGGSFLKELISVTFQIGNAACVLGTVSNRNAFEESCFIWFVFYT